MFVLRDLNLFEKMDLKEIPYPSLIKRVWKKWQIITWIFTCLSLIFT